MNGPARATFGFLLKKLALFCFLLVPSYLMSLLVFTSGFFNNWIPNVRNFTGAFGHSLVRFQEIHNFTKMDILFFGSSQVYRGFDPRVFSSFGLRIFDMGSPAQTSMNSYYLLRKFIDHVDPSLFVLEVGSLADHGGDESTIDLISNMPYSKDMQEMGIQTLREFQMRTMNSILAAYIRRIFVPLSEARQRYDAENIYISNGYVKTCRATNTEARLEMVRPQVRGAEVAYLRRIIELVSKKGRRLLLVCVPISKALKMNITNYREFSKNVNVLASEYHVAFIDFNEDAHSSKIGLQDDVDFYDGTHLNQIGVEKFNRYFIRYVCSGTCPSDFKK